MRRVRRTAVGGICALLLSSGVVLAAQGTQLDPALCDPDQNTFTTTIDNTYFPLAAGMQWVLSGQEQGTSIGLRITVTGETETFYKGRDRVTTLEVEELEWADENQDGIVDPTEELIEVSLNYYAQTNDATVCYFGELVDIYEGGEVVSHEGAWRADDPGNAPGIFMPADPAEGMTFKQELAPGIAEDTATIVSIGQTVAVPAGTFTNTLKVRDFNPLDGSRGTKVYAPAVGIIRDGPLDLISTSPWPRRRSAAPGRSTAHVLRLRPAVG